MHRPHGTSGGHPSRTGQTRESSRLRDRPRSPARGAGRSTPSPEVRSSLSSFAPDCDPKLATSRGIMIHMFHPPWSRLHPVSNRSNRRRTNPASPRKKPRLARCSAGRPDRGQRISPVRREVGRLTGSRVDRRTMKLDGHAIAVEGGSGTKDGMPGSMASEPTSCSRRTTPIDRSAAVEENVPPPSERRRLVKRRPSPRISRDAATAGEVRVDGPGGWTISSGDVRKTERGGS